MEFSSIIFLVIFLPIFLFSYFLIKNNTYRNIILLLFSLVFYAFGEPIYILLMIASIIINYLLALLMDKHKNKLLLILAITINIGLLIIFKYTDFIIDINNFLFNTSFVHKNILLPIGISFYTFQILSYVIDVYLGKVKVQKNILFLGCYITAFPQLIAGPIVRYETIEDELINRKTNIDNFYQGLRLFIIGLSKKVLIANNVGYVADHIFQTSPSTYGFIGVITSIICYTLQIYYDFSGYSDMAIGIGKMLGFNFPKNFNYPYIAESITDFWRRWHITLSTWFKEYVYIPLGGNKVKPFRHIINILIVWLLTGLWHGASINFLCWGLFYAIFLLIEKYLLKNILNRMPKLIRHLYTLIIVMLGWNIFYHTNIGDLLNSFKALIGLYGFGSFKVFIYTESFTVINIIAFIAGIIFAMPIIKETKNKYLNMIYDIILILLFILCLVFLISNTYNPFIYFRF
ncbi:MAG: MBOAT family protein [Bacilli bacterium]|nr:MBOAT family protein [Bacilli bacterium]